jgi:hypothetical protein
MAIGKQRHQQAVYKNRLADDGCVNAFTQTFGNFTRCLRYGLGLNVHDALTTVDSGQIASCPSQGLFGLYTNLKTFAAGVCRAKTAPMLRSARPKPESAVSQKFIKQAKLMRGRRAMFVSSKRHQKGCNDETL